MLLQLFFFILSLVSFIMILCFFAINTKEPFELFHIVSDAFPKMDWFTKFYLLRIHSSTIHNVCLNVSWWFEWTDRNTVLIKLYYLLHIICSILFTIHFFYKHFLKCVKDFPLFPLFSRILQKLNTFPFIFKIFVSIV